MRKWDLNQYGERPPSPGPTGALPERGFPAGVSRLCSGSPGALRHLYLRTWALHCQRLPPIPPAWAWDVPCFGQQGTGRGLNARSLHFPSGCSLASQYRCTQDPSHPDPGPGLEHCQVGSLNMAVCYTAKATWLAAHEPKLGFQTSVLNIHRRGREREPSHACCRPCC